MSYDERLRLTRKVIVLAHYSKGPLPACCWHGCKERDLDCLTLDHMRNDGSKNRLPCGRRRGGAGLYRWIIKQDFPRGYQTLCGSHQTKKENERRRNNAHAKNSSRRRGKRVRPRNSR